MTHVCSSRHLESLFATERTETTEVGELVSVRTSSCRRFVLLQKSPETTEVGALPSVLSVFSVAEKENVSILGADPLFHTELVDGWLRGNHDASAVGQAFPGCGIIGPPV